MVYRPCMVSLHDKIKILEAIAARGELTALERAVVMEAAARFTTDAAASMVRECHPELVAATPTPPAPAQSALAQQVRPETDAILFTDGASRGNPGPAGIGAVLKATDGQQLAEIAEYIGHTTNNVAEYRALLAGLKRALALGMRRIEVRADSELMIKQLRGDYQVKNQRLAPLYREALSLMEGFEKVELRHVRREHNARADELANAGIDSAR